MVVKKTPLEQLSELSGLEKVAFALELDKDKHERATAVIDGMNEYFVQGGKDSIHNLDDINHKHATTSLAKIMGFKQNNPKGLRSSLVKQGVYSIKLSEYEPSAQEHIIKVAISNLSKQMWFSSYFYPNLPEDVLNTNRSFFIHSQSFKNHLINRGIKSIDDVNPKDVTFALGAILGLKQYHSNSFKSLLVKNGIFSQDLSNYGIDDLEHIASVIISHSNKKSPWKSAYFTNVPDELKESNIGAILGTETVINFLGEEKTELDDIENASLAAKRLFRRIGLLDYNRADKNPKSRVVTKQWNDPNEIESLSVVYELCDGDEQEIKSYLKENRDDLEQEFGVTINAIEKKMQSEGLLPGPRYPIEGRKINMVSTYPFPKIHSREFPDSVEIFNNISLIYSKGNVPSPQLAIPFLGFDTAVHEQLVHVTLPIRYRGASIDVYNKAEQRVIQVASQYISDNTGFEELDNEDLKTLEELKKDDPRIVKVRSPGRRNFVQLIYRKSFNPKNQTRSTAIIDGDHTYLHLKHDSPISFKEIR